jgi:hypothetical protein
MRFLGCGDRPTDSYVLPNLKFEQSDQLRKVGSCSRLGVIRPNRAFRGVATAFSGPLHKFLRSTVLAWNARGIIGTVAAELTFSAFSAMTTFPALPAFLPSPPLLQLLIYPTLGCFIHTNQLRPLSEVTFASELARGIEPHVRADVR